MSESMSLADFQASLEANAKKILTKGWKLRRKVQVGEQEFIITGNDEQELLEFASSWGQTMQLPVEVVETLMDDLHELGAVASPKAEAIKALGIVRHMVCQLPVVAGHEESAISMITVLDGLIAKLEG